MMYIKTSLKLLSEKFESVAKTPYFNSAIEKYAAWFVAVIDHALSCSKVNENTLYIIFNGFKVYYRYLKGSSINETPYEIEYCMHSVLKKWFPKEDFGIATAIDSKFKIFFPDCEFSIVDLIPDLLGNFKEVAPKEKLILLELPNWFNYTPLFCVPFYHELGHYVDARYDISSQINFDNKELLTKQYDGNKNKFDSYTREYFADIFACCYVGEAMIKMFQSVVYNETLLTSTDRHPSINDRIKFMKDFINNPHEEKFNMYHDEMKSAEYPELKRCYEILTLNDKFDYMLPYEIKKNEELHGIFLAGWKYLEEIEKGIICPDWTKTLCLFDKVRIINSLVEKSIRNYSIRKNWNGEEQ